jgi:hypothetical protein
MMSKIGGSRGMDYFFEDYHFCITLTVLGAAVDVRLDIHDLSLKQRLQTIQMRLDETSAEDALIQAQLRMRQWLRYRQHNKALPSSVADIKALLTDKAEREEHLYQQLVDAESEDARIECFYRMQQSIESTVLRVVRAMARLPARERDQLYEQEPNLVAEMLSYDVGATSQRQR